MLTPSLLNRMLFLVHGLRGSSLRIAALSSFVQLQFVSGPRLCFCLRTLQALALPVELFQRTEFAQHGYESYVTSVRLSALGSGTKREVDKR